MLPFPWLLLVTARAFRPVHTSIRRVLGIGATLLAVAMAGTVTVSAQPAPVGTIGLTPGWVTFGQVVPRGLAREGLRVGSLATQTDIKTTWDDGSIRFAVVTVNAPAAGNYDITPGPSSSPAFAPALPSAVVTLAVYTEPTSVISQIAPGPAARITTAKPHGLVSGEVIDVTWSNSNPPIEGPQTVTVVDDTHFTVPVTVACGDFLCTSGRFMRLAASKKVYTAALPATASADRWLSGALAYEGRSVVAPAASDGTEHPFLRVVFDTRAYADGAGRVDVIVENTLDKAGATTVWYDVNVSIDGQTRYTHPVGTVASAPVQHYYLTRWRKVFETGGPAGSIRPDVTPFNIAGALPPFLPIVADGLNVAAGPAYDILQPGAMNRLMWDHGGRQELAPLPDWTARYLVHKNPAQLRFVLANGDLSGSWPMHVREPDDSATAGVGPDRFVSLDQRPTVWLDDRAATEPIVLPADRLKGGPMPMHEYGDGIPAADVSPLSTDNAHQPSLAYVPYLLTGDRYYGEEMGFMANYAMIRTYDGDGVRGSLGVLENNEVRGYGWALRNLVDAAAYSPNAEARAYFSQKVRNNLEWLDGYANAQDASTNPLQILWAGYRPEIGFVSLWEQTYLAYALERARAQGFAGGLAHRDAIARMQYRLFTGDPDYPREAAAGCNPTTTAPGQPCAWAAPYLIAAGNAPDSSSWAGFTFFTTMKDIADHTVGNADLQRDYAGFYGPEARLNLMIAINNKWDRAQDAYNYLFPFIGENNAFCAESNGGTGNADRPDLACRAGWAIDFYPFDVPVPPVNHAPAITAIADQTNTVGDEVVLAVVATDADNDALTFSATALPDGLTIDSATGTISGVVTTPGDFAVTISVADTAASATASFAWHVLAPPPPPNHAPVLPVVLDQTSEVGEGVNLPITATDADNDSLTYSAEGLPNGLAIDALTGAITGALTATGDFTVAVAVTDGKDRAQTSFLWHGTRRAAIVSPAPGGVFTSSTQTFTWDAGAGVTSTRLDIGSSSGLADVFAGQFGSATLQVVTGLPVDGRQLFVRISSEINGAVKANEYVYTAFTFVNHVPVIEPIGAQGGQVGDTVLLTVRATDEDNDALSYRADGLPEGLTIDDKSGVISGTLSRADSFAVTVTVSDGAASASASFAWVVAAPPPPQNLPPAVGPLADQTNTLGDVVSLTIAASDPEGQPLSFSTTGLPPGLTLNAASGVVSGMLFAIGDFAVTVTVSDGTSVTSVSFIWHVARPAGLVSELKNPGPQQNRAADEVELQLQVVYNALAVKLAGGEDRLARLVDFNARNLPRGLRINRDKATIRGKIDNGAVGVYQVTVTVTELGGRQLSQTFEWTVLPRLRTSGGHH